MTTRLLRRFVILFAFNLFLLAKKRTPTLSGRRSGNTRLPGRDLTTVHHGEVDCRVWAAIPVAQQEVSRTEVRNVTVLDDLLACYPLPCWLQQLHHSVLHQVMPTRKANALTAQEVITQGVQGRPTT